MADLWSWRIMSVCDANYFINRQLTRTADWLRENWKTHLSYLYVELARRNTHLKGLWWSFLTCYPYYVRTRALGNKNGEFSIKPAFCVSTLQPVGAYAEMTSKSHLTQQRELGPEGRLNKGGNWAVANWSPSTPIDVTGSAVLIRMHDNWQYSFLS